MQNTEEERQVYHLWPFDTQHRHFDDSSEYSANSPRIVK